MWKDEVLEEIYRIREEHAYAFNFDLQAICDDLRHKQSASGRQIISTHLTKKGAWVGGAWIRGIKIIMREVGIKPTFE